jgi:hypothetical protein
MIDTNIQACYIRCIIDQINPIWMEKCNHVNLYNEKIKNNLTVLYMTDDRKRILYITNKIYAFSKDGFPWSQKFEKYLKPLLPHTLSNTLISYSGILFNEFCHGNSLITLSEYMRVENFNPNLLCDFLNNLKDILKYHLSVFCFSENLLLVDKKNENILLSSYNYIISLSHSIPEELFKVFKHKLHPIVSKHMKNLKQKPNSIANTGLYSPSKMKQICIRLVEKDAATDRAYLLSSIIYYFATIGTLWKLQKQQPLFSKNKRCDGLCLLSKNHTNTNLRKTIHDYVCVEIVNNLPINFKKTNALYPEFVKRVNDLQKYLMDLN